MPPRGRGLFDIYATVLPSRVTQWLAGFCDHTDVTGWTIAEASVGLFLVFVASYVIARPRYRTGRFMLGMAVAAFAVGIVGVVDGLAGV